MSMLCCLLVLGAAGVASSAIDLGLFGGYGNVQYGNWSTHVGTTLPDKLASVDTVTSNYALLLALSDRSLALQIHLASTLLTWLRFQPGSNKVGALWRRFLSDRTPAMQAGLSQTFLQGIQAKGYAEATTVPEWSLLHACYVKRPLNNMTDITINTAGVDPLQSYVQTLGTLSRGEAIVIPAYLDSLVSQLNFLANSSTGLVRDFVQGAPSALTAALAQHPQASRILQRKLKQHWPQHLQDSLKQMRRLEDTSPFVLHPRQVYMLKGNDTIVGADFQLTMQSRTLLKIQNLAKSGDLHVLCLTVDISAESTSWGTAVTSIPAKYTSQFGIPLKSSDKAIQVFIAFRGPVKPVIDALYQTILPRLSVQYAGELLIWLQASLVPYGPQIVFTISS